MADPLLDERLTGRALVVDDDPVMRVIASRALTALGFEVEEVEDGEQALAALDRRRPDLVVLDVELPGRDGFQTCREMRERPQAETLPILIATGHTDAETIESAFRAGATDFIKKPLDWQLLQHRVRFILRASQAMARVRHTVSELQQSQRRLADAQRLARMGSWEWLLDENQMLWSEELYRIFALEPGPGTASYERFLALVHAEDRAAVEKAMRDAACEARSWSLDHRIVLASGDVRIVHQQAEVTPGPDGSPDRISGTLQDVTEQHRAEERIRYLAYYDSTTALPNRRMLSEYLEKLIRKVEPQRGSFAVLYMNLDRFKRINDTLGHGIGDRLLRETATRLTTRIRATDWVGQTGARAASVSRLPGDEFAVVLTDIRSADDAGTAARRILEILRTPFSVDQHHLSLTGSVGIAVFPADGRDRDALLHNANVAMRDAKAGGRDAYRFFSESMNEQAMQRFRLEAGLRQALEGNELRLHYQPQLDAATNRITSVEALIRWQSPNRGMVSPGEFIPVAEESGLIRPIGMWVLGAACEQVRAWRTSTGPDLKVAVNVSSHQVRSADLVPSVERALASAAIEPSRLEVEITESAVLGDDAEVVARLQALKELGVGLALDDFGTGFSSLSHLARLPIDTVKIDQSFVRRLPGDAQARAIVTAVISMAQGLGLRVVAEGVETAEQEAALREQGCHVLQGYRFGRPMEAAALETLLRGGGPEGTEASSTRR